MKKFLALLVVALAGALALWLARRERPERDALAPSAPSALQLPNAELATSSDLGHAERQDRVAVESPKTEPVPASASASSDPNLATIRGRCALEDGLPAHGVTIVARGWEANPERVREFGKPSAWTDPTVTSGDDGRFELRLDPPRAYQFVLEAKLEGCAPANWRWSEIEPGSTRDLGDVVMRRGGTITGRILDAGGKTLTTGWAAQAECNPARPGDPDSEQTNHHGGVDPATGFFRITNLAPGPARLSASSELTGNVGGPTVEVIAGAVVEAEIRYRGPDVTRRIAVRVSTLPFRTATSDVKNVALVLPDGSKLAAIPAGRRLSTFEFNDVQPGSYSIEISDPHFLPWRQDGVQTGTLIKAKLAGASSIALSVTDAGSGEKLDRYALDVRLDDSSRRPNTFRVREANADAPPGGVYAGLLPVPQTLIVTGEGRAPVESKLDPPLTAGEVRSVTISVSTGARIVGTVRAAGASSPEAGIPITLRRTWKLPESGHSSMPDQADTRRQTTDARGRFAFELVPSGAWTVEAKASAFVLVERDLVIDANECEHDVELVLPACGTLVGRIFAPEGTDFEGLTVLVTPEAFARVLHRHPRFVFDHEQDSAKARIGADGSFASSPTPVGNARVTLELASPRIPNGAGGWTIHSKDPIELGLIEIVPGETRREFDVRAGMPGAIRVFARLGGDPAKNVIVAARWKEPLADAGTVLLDGQGQGTIVGLAPGRYRLTLRAAGESWAFDGAWIADDPRTFDVEAGKTLGVTLDLARNEIDLAIVDGRTSTPYAGWRFALGPADEDYFTSQTTTDANGIAKLALTPGRYRIWPIDRDGGSVPPTTFEWTAAGPVPASVTIPP